MQRHGSAAVMGLAALAVPGPALAASMPSLVPTSFTVRSLEPQPGDSSGGAAGLSNWGDAVGTAFYAPALFANRQVIPLLGLTAENPPLLYGGASAINDQGIGRNRGHALDAGRQLRTARPAPVTEDARSA